MRCCFSSIRSSIRDYDKIQSAAVLLIYIQIGCALVGSLGALFNGVLVINLVVALFALVAIENNSQSLGRTYAVLLACGISLDVVWFVLFSHEIWNISSEKYGPPLIFSVRLTLAMQIIGFAVRLLSSLLWIQMYRLGASSVDSTISRYSDVDIRNSLLSPSSQVPVRQNSSSDDILGCSMYDSSYYTSLFDDSKDNRQAYEESPLDNHISFHLWQSQCTAAWESDSQSIGDSKSTDDKSTSAAGTLPLKLCKSIFSRFMNECPLPIKVGRVCIELPIDHRNFAEPNSIHFISGGR